jgi:release factor glutamine methyltransferase
MSTVRAALAAGAAQLRAAGVPDAAGDARHLMSLALGIGPDRLTLHLPDAIDPAAEAAFSRLLARRAAREPFSQIAGERLFWGRRFRVTRDVLDPRPETEILLAEALRAPFGRVLDIGTGSGAILLSLLADRPGATGVGTDASSAALAVAADNAAALGLADRAALVATDWAAGVAGPFDLIVTNPPYIAAAEFAALAPEVRDWEPGCALTDGADGLSAYRAILPAVPGLLAPGGRFLCEIGPSQGAAVSALARAAGLAAVRLLPDLDGRDRVVAAARPPA